MKKKVLIATLNDYIIYQPTILNLYDFLQPHFDVTIISFQPKAVTKQKDTSRNVVYLKTNFISSQFYQKIDFFVARFLKKRKPEVTYYNLFYNKYLPGILRKALKQYKNNVDIVIAADFPALYEAQNVFGAVNFLSLEIDNNTNRYYKLIDKKRIKSVIVQSQMRYDYLFGDTELKTFFVHNSPVFTGKPAVQPFRKDFLWAGAIDRRLAVIECLEFFKHYPEYRLTLKGGGDKKTARLIEELYSDLLSSGRIVIDKKYLPEESFIEFISGFKIGFCFYSWPLIASSFNYQSAPSGKLLMYMAAGTPVVACNIPGFKFIEEKGAGVLIDDYKPETILQAVKKIEANYEKYSEACYEIASLCSFDRNIGPYIEFLKEQ